MCLSKKDLILALCVVLTTCFYTSTVCANKVLASPITIPSPAPEKALGASGVSLRLFAYIKSADVEAGNMVLLQVDLVNTTGNDISLISQGDPDNEFVFVVKNSQGKDIPLSLWGKSLFKYKPDYLPTTVPYESVRAGGKKTYQFSLNRMFDLSVPTTYSVVVSRTINFGPGRKTEELSSDKVLFRVDNPPVNFSDPNSFPLR